MNPKNPNDFEASGQPTGSNNPVLSQFCFANRLWEPCHDNGFQVPCSASFDDCASLTYTESPALPTDSEQPGLPTGSHNSNPPTDFETRQQTLPCQWPPSSMLFQQALRTLLPQHYLRTPSLSSPTSVPNLALVSQFMPAQKPYLPNLLLSSPYLNLDRSKHLEPTYTMHLIAKLSTHSLLIALPTASTFIPVATHNFVAFLLLQTKFLSLDLVFDKVLIQLLAHLLSCLCLWSCFWSYLSVYPCACLDFLPQFPQPSGTSGSGQI